MKPTILLYGHTYCPQVHTVRAALDEGGVDYEYIDILKDVDGRLRVKEINHGNESVPTLVFPDGSTLTEPSQEELSEHFKSHGFPLRPLSIWQQVMVFLDSPTVTVIGALMAVAGYFYDIPFLLTLGAVLVLIPIFRRGMRNS